MLFSEIPLLFSKFLSIIVSRWLGFSSLKSFPIHNFLPKISASSQYRVRGWANPCLGAQTPSIYLYAEDKPPFRMKEPILNGTSTPCPLPLACLFLPSLLVLRSAGLFLGLRLEGLVLSCFEVLGLTSTMWCWYVIDVLKVTVEESNNVHGN